MSAFTDYLERFAEINIMIIAFVILLVGAVMVFGTDTKERPHESYIQAWVRSYQLHLLGLVLVIVAALAYYARKQPLFKALMMYFR